jgi:hypothetical protein
MAVLIPSNQSHGMASRFCCESHVLCNGVIFCHAQFTFWLLPDQLPRKRRAEAPTTTAHEWHGRYSILKHAPYNLKYKSCAKLKRAQLIQKEKRKRIAIMMVLQATS